MKTFVDNAGRTWELTVDPFDVKRIQARLGYNLLDLQLRDGALEAWMQDPIRQVDTLWLLCEAQARQADVSEEDFGRSLRGVLYAADMELLQELIHVFPSQGQRDELTARLALQLQGMELNQQTQVWVTTRLKEIMTGIEPSATGSSSPASSVSVPAV